MKPLQLLLTILLTTSSVQLSAQSIVTPLGIDIVDQPVGEGIDNTVALSSDGNRMAVGTYLNDNAATNAGLVRIYERSGSNWIQMGNKLEGAQANAKFGVSLLLSANGTRVAIVSVSPGPDYILPCKVQLYDWNGNSWVQAGTDIIFGHTDYQIFTNTVSISADGNRVVIGDPFYNNNIGTIAFFDWDGNSWNQTYSNIEVIGRYTGTKIALSSNGQRVALATFVGSYPDVHFNIVIYDFDGTEWNQIGNLYATIASEGIPFSLGLSSDGNRLSIGDPADGSNGEWSGRVSIFDWNGLDWNQIKVFQGASTYGFFGINSVLSLDGNTIAISNVVINNSNSITYKSILYNWNGANWVTIDGNPSDINDTVMLGNVSALDESGNQMAVVKYVPFGGDPNGADLVRVYQKREGCAFPISATVIDETCPGAGNGSITVSSTGEYGTFAYSLDGGVTNQASNVFPGLASGNYTVTVIVDGATSCYATATAIIGTSTTPDSDGDGIADACDACPYAIAGIANFNTNTCGCASGYTANTTGINGNTVVTGCTPTPACTGNKVVVSIQTDNAPSQTTWTISNEYNAVLATGGPNGGQSNTVVDQTVCLGTTAASACYHFRLMDAFGDGINSGRWQLRTTGGAVILQDAFANGGASPASPPNTSTYGSAHSFCLPLGPSQPKANYCGIFDYVLNSRIYVTPVSGATQYEYEFSDPDAGYLRQVVKSTSSVLMSEFGGNVNPLTPGERYFCRVRTNNAGPLSAAHFGSGCEMGLSFENVVQCSQLISAPNYGHSCNEARAYASSAYSFIYATPITGASAYTFHIYIPGEPTALDTTITRNTYILQLKWPGGRPMENGSTYNVDVKTTVNGVTGNYCAPYCTISINNSYNGASNYQVQVNNAYSGSQLWPNPVSDGMVNLALDGLVDEEQQIDITLYDVYGKQLLSRNFENSGDRFSTTLLLSNEVTSGVYLVQLTVNGTTTLQRLSVVR